MRHHVSENTCVPQQSAFGLQPGGLEPLQAAVCLLHLAGNLEMLFLKGLQFAKHFGFCCAQRASVNVVR